MTAQPAIHPSGTRGDLVRRYRAAACVAVLALSLASGLALEVAPSGQQRDALAAAPVAAGPSLSTALWTAIGDSNMQQAATAPAQQAARQLIRSRRAAAAGPSASTLLWSAVGDWNMRRQP